MQTLHVSTKEGQVGVWRDARDRARGRVAADCSVMGPRRRGGDTRHSPPRHSRAPAAGPQHAATIRRDIAQPPPQWGTLTLKIYKYGFLDVQFCV